MIQLMIQFKSKRYDFKNGLGFVCIVKLNYYHSYIIFLIFLLIDSFDSSRSFQGLKEFI